MKIFGTDSFVNERAKVKPITNAEWNNTKNYIKELAIREITPINTRSALHWDCYCSDKKIHYDYESYDKWYMFQNENIILFWNKPSEYYPFFFKKDIENVMKFESYTLKALWHAIRAVEPVPDTPLTAYNKFVRSFDKYVRDYFDAGPYDFNVVKKIPKEIKEIINLYHTICLNKEQMK